MTRRTRLAQPPTEEDIADQSSKVADEVENRCDIDVEFAKTRARIAAFLERSETSRGRP